MSDTPKPASLLEKLSAVTRACSYIQKDGVNQFHRYNYATAAIVFEKVNQALWDNRLISKPIPHIETRSTRKNAKGGDEEFVTVRMDLTILDLDGGGSLSTRAFGSGMDNGDKAVMKAQTAALKYAWIDLLNISTGDDPEGDATVDSRAEGKPIDRGKPRGPYTGGDTLPGKGGSKSTAPVSPPTTVEEEPPKDEERPSIFGEPEAETCKKQGCASQVLTFETKAGKKYRACHAAKQDYAKFLKAGIAPDVAKERTAGHTWHWLGDPKSVEVHE